MTIVTLGAGLGNQMFQYAFYLARKAKGDKVETLVTYTEGWEHVAGFELERVFGIKRENVIWEFLYNQVTIPFRKIFQILHPQYRGNWNFKYHEQDMEISPHYRLYCGTWQSELYFKDIRPVILDTFKFDEIKCNAQTLFLKQTIFNANAVSVHVRRGDYLNEHFKDGFGSCCPIDYYVRSIRYMKEHTDNPLFVFFSDDMEWVKENIIEENAIYVDHNHDFDAWQDMFLMSKCKHNITANSSFSWWGAWLNENLSKIVISPVRWWATFENDDVVPDSWIRM